MEDLEFNDLNDANLFLKNILKIDIAMYNKFVEEKFENAFVFVKHINNKVLREINTVASAYKHGNISIVTFKTKIAKIIGNEFCGYSVTLDTGKGIVELSANNIYEISKQILRLFDEYEFLEFVKYIYEKVFAELSESFIKKAPPIFNLIIFPGTQEPFNFETLNYRIKELKPQVNQKKHI